MEMFYSIPIRADQLIEGKKLDMVDLRRSIHQNIHLIVKTLNLSYSFDPSFGSLLNRYHARTPPQKKSESRWRENIREELQKNLRDVFQKYETRIVVENVTVDLIDPPEKQSKSVVSVRVEVKGHFNLGRKEKFHYPDSEIEEEAREIFPLVIPVGKT
jgi:phage baseplate assembly protein W